MAIRKIKTQSGQPRWEVYLSLSGRGSKCVRRRFKRKIDAEEFLQNYGENISYTEGKDEPNHLEVSHKRTFKEEAYHWLEVQRPNFSLNNFQRSLDVIEKLVPLIGEIPLEKFNPSFLYRLRSDLLKKKMVRGKNGKDVTNAALNRWLTLVTTVINFSTKQQRIPYNPSVGFQKLREDKKGIDFWTLEEAMSFLKFAHEKYPKDSPKRWVYVVYLLAINTGLRAGEIWGLQKKDLEREDCIKIERQWAESHKTFMSPKSRKSRMAPCNSHLKAELDDLISSRGVGEQHNTLFFNTNGAPFNHANFLHRYFRRDVEELGIRKIRFHDLRHTALTLMVSKGIDLRTVQEIAGHSDIKTTIQYVHLLGENVKKASSVFSVNPT